MTSTFLPQAQQPIIKSAVVGVLNDVWDENAHAQRVIIAGGSIMNSAVTASGDWSNPATAKADITAATGVQFPADSAKNPIYVTLWRGFAFPTEYATLYCGDTPAWVATNGFADPFTNVPTAGIVVTIVGMVNLPTP